jgi:site-specific recombinase XerD
LLQAFFMDRLVRQRQASAHTISSYRDTFCMLLSFVHDRTKIEPSKLSVADLDAPMIGAFLDHLERERGNCPRTRNARLAAVRSFFKFVALHDPAHSAVAQRVIAMPAKRCDRKLVGFLTRPEIDALLRAPDRSTWLGCRDHALLLLAVQTGLRVSKLTGLCCQDVVLDDGAHVRCLGKGRKERCTPLRKDARLVLRSWLDRRDGHPDEPLFCTARGRRLSRHGVVHLLDRHVHVAQRECASLQSKRVSPHVLRHTTAMELLRSGVDRTVIALWLGHESIETTQMYLDADLEMKERALAKTTPLRLPHARYQPDDALLAFLREL